MAINQNHPFEDIDGVKCAVVEKNAGAERVSFLKNLLEGNGYTVMIAPAAPAKATPAVEEGTAPSAPSLFTVGVTDVMFNSTNAVFGRLLRTKDGRVVTLDYWQQRSSVAEDQVPYFSKSK